MKRRDFITLLGGAAAWPLAAAAQQRERMRRIGLLLTGAADDPESLARVGALLQGLQELGWTDGRNVRLEYRWGSADAERIRKSAAELVALAPDVILVSGNSGMAPLHRATPYCADRVCEYQRPSRRWFRHEPSASWWECDGVFQHRIRHERKMAGVAQADFARRHPRRSPPRSEHPVRELAVGRDPGRGGPFLGVEISPIDARDDGEIERGVTDLARSANGGLIVPASTPTISHRKLIIALAAQHRLPAIYPYRFFVADGGLVSYGADSVDPFRRAAAYVDRILKGEKPGDLPIQAPTKFELVINLKTAKALGLEIPATVLARADEVIE